MDDLSTAPKHRYRHHYSSPGNKLRKEVHRNASSGKQVDARENSYHATDNQRRNAILNNVWLSCFLIPKGLEGLDVCLNDECNNPDLCECRVSLLFQAVFTHLNFSNDFIPGSALINNVSLCISPYWIGFVAPLNNN